MISSLGFFYIVIHGDISVSWGWFYIIAIRWTDVVPSIDNLPCILGAIGEYEFSEHRAVEALEGFRIANREGKP